MSCCGSHRAAQRTLRQSLPVLAQNRTYSGVSAQVLPLRHVTFEFSGVHSIVVTGPATGTTYRFLARGARLTVHAADAPSLVSVPGLRPVL